MENNPIEHDARVSVREKPMGFLDHLEDLRWTVVKSAIVFVAFAGLIGFYLKEFNHALLWPLETVQKNNPGLILELGTNKIMEGFSIIVQMCCSGGLILSAPFIIFFIAQFVSPALSEKELKVVLPVSISAFALFFAGAAFGFFLLIPSTLKVSVEINTLLGYAMRWTPDSYYSLLLWMVLGVGASFEFPLLIVLAVYLGLITAATLRKFRRHAIVAIFIIAAVVTPTPDPVTQLMFAAPLYILFETSILVAARMSKRETSPN